MTNKRLPAGTTARLVAAITVWIFLIPFSVHSQNFEGIIHYEIPELEKEIGTSNLDYMIKDGMIRIEYKTGGKRSTSLLYEEKSQRMFLKISSLGGHVEVPPDDVKQNFLELNAQFEETGESKELAGRRCTIWKASLDGDTYQYCFASKMGNFILPVNSMTAGSVPSWAGVSLPKDQLPLEVIRLKNGEKGEVVMSTREINEVLLNKNLFSVFN